MPPPDPFTGPAAARPNPYLTRLRRELTAQRDTFVGRQALPLLYALELYCAEQDRRIGALEAAIAALAGADGTADIRVRDLERQVTDQAQLLQRQAERINGLMPPGEFVTDEQFAAMQGQVHELIESAIDRAGEDLAPLLHELNEAAIDRGPA